MKYYFNFTLKAGQLLPIWIAFFFFVIIPYYLLLGELAELTSADITSRRAFKTILSLSRRRFINGIHLHFYPV